MNSKQFFTLVATVAFSTIGLQSVAHASGKSQKRPEPRDITDKAAYFEAQIAKFNVDNANLVLGDERTHRGDECGKAPDMSDFQRKAFEAVCERIEVILPKDEKCSNLIEIKATSRWASARVDNYANGMQSVYGNRVKCRPLGSLTLSLTGEGKKLAGSVLLFEPRNPDIGYNVRHLSKALGTIYMTKESRKRLEGLLTSTAAFVLALDQEADKAAKGQPSKPYMHSDFVSHATLVTSYYRYLAKDIAQLDDFRSTNDGEIRSNRDAVTVVAQAATNIINAYGLEVGVNTKKVADYGRVFLDVLERFSQGLTAAEKQFYIRPLMEIMASQVVPISIARGDLSASPAVYQFQAVWENPRLQLFFLEKLSSTDESLNHQIMTLSNLAFQIGDSAGVRIRAFSARDVDSLREHVRNSGNGPFLAPAPGPLDSSGSAGQPGRWNQ